MPIEPALPRAHGTLFHTGISNPRGTDMLPLSMLRDRYPDLHARHAAKYAGREHRLRERVIPLDCTWADVVFFSPLDSTVLFDALRSRSGGESEVGGGRVWNGPVWTLDASGLDPERCCIRLMRVTRGARSADPGTEDDYLPLTTAGLRAVSEVTDRALERLRTLRPGEPVLPWGDVPHVLHRGPVPLGLFREPTPGPTPGPTPAPTPALTSALTSSPTPGPTPSGTAAAAG